MGLNAMGHDPQLEADRLKLKRLGARRKLLAPPADDFHRRLCPYGLPRGLLRAVKIGALGTDVLPLLRAVRGLHQHTEAGDNAETACRERTNCHARQVALSETTADLLARAERSDPSENRSQSLSSRCRRDSLTGRKRTQEHTNRQRVMHAASAHGNGGVCRWTLEHIWSLVCSTAS